MLMQSLFILQSSVVSHYIKQTLHWIKTKS